jgi:hypothetical protein
MLNSIKKIQRLRCMDLEELLYRVHERLRVTADRFRYSAGIGFNHDAEFNDLLDRHQQSIKSYLRAGPAQRFYASTSEERRESVMEFIIQKFPGWVDRSVDDADRLRSHQMNILGYSNVFVGTEIDWNRDPITEYEWAPRFWADVEVIGNRHADAKIIYEFNRQQHLVRLGKTYFITGVDEYAREAIAQMDSWIQQNPIGCGVNWKSSLDIGIRALSWMWTIFFVMSSKSFDEPAARRILKSLFRQLDQVYRYPSTYSSPNTHLIGEACALFIAGLLFPELRRAAEWRQFGATMLVSEMQKQVSSEGVYREASTYYHCYATDFYLHAMVLARASKFPFPEWMWSRLSQMFEFVLHITQPDGAIPLIGDDDGGRVLALKSEDYGSYRDGLSSGAVLFGRADLKYAANGYAEETMWLLGTETFDVFESLDQRAPLTDSKAYPENGYFVQRSSWDDNASHMVFDCGNLGMLTGGHGHADALSFTLFSHGQPLLIDPGTSVYNAAAQWRQFFRSTRAHNTVVVDDLEQSEVAGPFSWKKKAAARVIAHRTMAGIDYVDGEHDGYLQLKNDVMHRRRVLFLRPDYWIVFDELQGRGAHDFDFLFHFAPGMKLFVMGEERSGDIECRARAEGAALQMFMHASGPLSAEATCGQTDPIQGWASRRYGERKPSPVLCAKLQSSTPATVMTVLAPGAEPVACRRISAGSRNRNSTVIATSVTHGDYNDVCLFSPDGAEACVGETTMRGEICWMRSQKGMLKQIVAINAKALSIRDDVIFENQEPMPYVLAHIWENSMVIERGDNEGKVYVRDLRYRQFQRH